MNRGYRDGGAPAVVFSGMLAGQPRHGGATWAVLNHLLGYIALGCDVTFVEPVEDATRTDVVALAQASAGAIGLSDRWCLVDPAGEIAGMDRARLRQLADDADVLINVSGMLTETDVLDRIECRVYLDLDPGFVQMWHASGIDMRLEGHTHFVSLADSIGAPDSPIPSCGHTWISTLPPVALESWCPTDGTVHDAFTSVANWRSYGTVHHQGRQYGQKAHFMRDIIDLPRRSADRFLLALSIDAAETDDLGLLHGNGWEVRDPARVASTPEQYRCFVRGSRAEVGITKSGYIAADSGWFSDRSACYLASGRPVIAGATGFDRRLPTGAGLFEFFDVDSFLTAADAVRTDIEGHRAAAHEIAREHLEASAVVARLLKAVL